MNTSHQRDAVTEVEPPLVIDSAESVAWNEAADVIVVGFGGAGVVASLESREGGASVIAVDRFSGGGATAASGGVIYAGGTRFQRDAGFDDTAEEMYKYLLLEESAVQPATLRRFCEGSNADVEWLVKHGVPFSGEAFLEKTTYPPEGRFLYYSGNEKTPKYSSQVIPVPRGHRSVGAGFTGAVYFSALRRSALSAGVKMIPHAPVRRLVIGKNSEVLGVEILAIPETGWERHQAFYAVIKQMKPFQADRIEKSITACKAYEKTFQGRRLLRARAGVVLAAGGFVYNLEMVRRHRPRYAAVYKALLRGASMGCDGSGIELGRSAGGTTSLMDSFFVGRSIAPPVEFIRGVLVDSDGRRFINEDAYTAFLGEAIGNLPAGGKAWLMLDRDGFQRVLKQCLFPGKGMYRFTAPSLLNIALGGTRRARSIAALAKKCGLSEAELRKSLDANNMAADSGQAQFDKSPENVAPVRRPPFYAVNMDLGNKFAMTILITLGGLVVDEFTGAVQRADGCDIGGLFAAGRTAVGLCSKGCLSGMAISDTVFSGRRAARHALQRLAAPKLNSKAAPLRPEAKL